MTKWIPCFRKLPKKRDWVKIHLGFGPITAKRSGLFGIGYWTYESGIKGNNVCEHDLWMPLQEYEKDMY